jgi:hypothetical protein
MRTKINRLSIDHNVGRIVIEYGGNVFTREGVGSVADQKASLTDGSV